MKRFVCSMLVLGLALSLAPFAAAQGGPAVTGMGGEDRALGIQLYGDLDLQMRYSNGAFNYGAYGSNEANWMGSPKLDLFLSAALADKASVLVQMQVPRVSGGNTQAFGPAASFGEHWVSVHQAYLKLDQLVTQDLSMTFGVQEVVLDLVGRGNPLVVALGRAEVLDPGAPFFSGKDESEVGGLRLDYKLGDAGNITVFHMINVNEGNVVDNEYMTAVDVTYKVMEKMTVEGMFGLMNVGGLSGSEIWVLGGGVSSNGEFVDGLNFYGQIYFEFGDYATDVDASGLMVDVGADYTFDIAWKPCVGVEYLFVTGDDGTSADENEAFVSYEDNNDLVVLEDKEFGFDIDENYSVIKLRASIQGDLLESPVKDAFKLEVLLGIAKLDEEVAGTLPGTTPSDKIGTELDVKASWMASKQLKVYTGIGWLFGSEVLENDLDEKTAFTFFAGTSVTF